MKPALIIGLACAIVVTGCSASHRADTDKSTTSTPALPTTTPAEAGSAHGTSPAPPGPALPEKPGSAHVALNNVNLSPAAKVGCRTDAGVTTITVDTTPKTTVVLSDESAPNVKSVRIGELGAEGPSLAYVPGMSGATAHAVREGNSFTVSGTGTGAGPSEPDKPVTMPFEIAATCP